MRALKARKKMPACMTHKKRKARMAHKKGRHEGKQVRRHLRNVGHEGTRDT